MNKSIGVKEKKISFFLELRPGSVLVKGIIYTIGPQTRILSDHYASGPLPALPLRGITVDRCHRQDR
jgi:hypothetical protein